MSTPNNGSTTTPSFSTTAVAGELTNNSYIRNLDLTFLSGNTGTPEKTLTFTEIDDRANIIRIAAPYGFDLNDYVANMENLRDRFEVYINGAKADILWISTSLPAPACRVSLPVPPWRVS